MKIKTFFVVLCLLLSFSSPSRALELSRIIQTGVQVLDAALNDIAHRGETTAGAIQIAESMMYYFGFAPSLTDSLRQRGYNYGEIYYLGLLHRRTGRSIDDLLLQNPRGIGWGNLAHRMGVHPSELNRTRVALKKDGKYRGTVTRMIVVDLDDNGIPRGKNKQSHGKAKKFEKGSNQEKHMGHPGKAKKNHGSKQGKGQGKNK